MDPNFFGLRENPFSKSESPDGPCLAQEHVALTAELHAGLKAPHGITLLIGEQGAGKTTFIRNFLGQLPETCVVAYLPTAGPGLRHLLTEIIEQLGGTVAAGGQEQGLIDTLRALAKARAEHDRATLVVIDDAHELPAKTIERLGKLFGPDAADPSRLHVTLVGRPELLDRMNAANDRSILKHLVQVCRMDAIGPEDAFRYIADRVQKVGGIVDRLFTEDALRLIVQRANGNPARIGEICTAALERAEGRGVASVDAEAVEAAGNTTEMAASRGMSMSDKQPETPTYFFNEDEDEQPGEPDAQIARSDALALPREGAAVAVPASRRRLVYWAAGAVAVVIAFAVSMTGMEFSLGTGKSNDVVDAPVRTATAEKRVRPDASTERNSGVALGEPTAIPKLVVKRGAGKTGDAGTAETPRVAGENDANSAAVAKTDERIAAPAAQPGSAVAAERPRFPAPALQPIPEPVVEKSATFPAIVTRPAGAGGDSQTGGAPALEPMTAEPAKPAEPAVAPAAAVAAAATSTAPVVSPAIPKVMDAPIPPTRPASPAAVAPKAKPAAIAPAAPIQVAAPKPSPQALPATGGRFTVQLGAFSSRANAEALLAKSRPAAADGRIVASSSDGKAVFRVIAGSFATQSEASVHAIALKKSGYPSFVRKLD